jgi:hypothetical protein
MAADGIRRMYFTGDPNDPEAREKWAEEVIDTLEKIQQGPLPWLPGGATREGLMEEILRSLPTDWEISTYVGEPEYFSWAANLKRKPDLCISLIAHREHQGDSEVGLSVTFHHRLVHSEVGLLKGNDIVLPSGRTSSFSYTDQHEELWRVIHRVRGLEDEFDHALVSCGS